MTTTARDQTLWWPLWAALSLPALDIVVQAISVNLAFPLFMFEGLLLVVWAAVSLCAGVLAVFAMLRRAWRRASVAAAFPTFVLFTVCNLLAVAHFCNDVADTIHFACLRGVYEERVTSLPPDGRRLAIFELGGMIWASRGIVYDETDQIMVDAVHQSGDWKARAADTELSCGYFAKPVPGPGGWSRHWYLTSFGC
jgi:hypothetical protein